MGKYKAKTEADWTDLLNHVSDYSVFFVQGDDFPSEAIQIGAASFGDDPNDPMKNFTANHAGNLITGLNTFEADGDKLRYHSLNDMKAKFMSGDIRILFYKPENWLPEYIPFVQKAIAEYNGQNYNGWENFFFGVGDALRFTPLHWLIDLIPNPAYKSNSVVCSQLTILLYKFIDAIYKPIVADLDISKMQPEELARRITRTFVFEYDTEGIIG